MTFEQALKLLGEETVAELRARLGPPKPLTPEQVDLLVRIFGDAAEEDADRAIHPNKPRAACLR